MSNQILIECKKLNQLFKKGPEEIRPLRELDLKIYKGEFLALMGPSGSGKTTLLNILAGIDKAHSGEVLFQGKDISRYSSSQLTKFRAANVGYIFQLYHLVPVLTAYENVELPLLITKLSRSERHRRVCQALDLVGISDRAQHYPRQLSGGQEQRVAIARALVADPPLIVADEPTGDLDSESAKRILDLLAMLCNELDKTVVMVTHDQKAADRANRCLHLEKGVLLGESQVDDDLTEKNDSETE